MRKTALVTDATGGIGEELCRELARYGYNLVITARDKTRLERQAVRLRRTYGTAVSVMPGDLAEKEPPCRIYNQMGEAGIVAEVLVNNAGYGIGGFFADSSLCDMEDMLQVNMLAATRLYPASKMTSGVGRPH